MHTLKRILAVVVMVTAALVLVLSLAGIAGTWIVRAQIYTGLDGIVTATQVRAEAVKQGMDRLDATLTQAHDEVVSVEQQVQALGTDLEQNKPLLTAISDKLDLQLSPLVDKVREIGTTIGETIVAVNSIVETVNTLPFVTKPVPELEAPNRLSQHVEIFRIEVQDLRMNVDRSQSEIIQGAVSIITTPTSQIGSTLADMQTTVSGVSQQVGAVQEGLAGLKSAIGRWLTWAAVILTLILLWLALSQAGLLVLGWRALLGQDLLPRKRRELSTEL